MSLIAAGIVNDNIRQNRNLSAAVKVENVVDTNGIGTSFKRINTLTALGEGYEVYLVSQEVPVDDTYISEYDPDKFVLEFSIDYAGVQFSKGNSVIVVDSEVTPEEETPSQTKTLYVLVCAPAGYTNAQQVIEYEIHHYHPYANPNFAIDETDEENTYLISCQ